MAGSSLWSQVLLACALTAAAVLVDPPAGALRQGVWDYQEPSGTEHFGQYVYASSPAGKRCLRNFTIHLAGGSMTCTAPLVVGNYTEDVACIPNAFEVVALHIDALNSRLDVLEDSCLQLSVNRYNYYHLMAGVVGAKGLADDPIDAITKAPTKHFLVGYDLVEHWAPVAKMFGLPFIEVGFRSLSQDFGPASDTHTTFSLFTNAAAMMPGALRRLMPDRFAVLCDQSTAGREFTKTVRELAPVYNKSVALESIVASDEDAMRLFVRQVVKAELRYILVVSSSTLVFQAQVFCAVHLEGLTTHLKIVLIGAIAEVPLGWQSTKCFDPAHYNESMAVGVMASEISGSIGFFPKSWATTDDDYLINKRTGSPGRTTPGSVNQVGVPWTHEGMNAVDTASCFDDNAEFNEHDLMRRYLDEEDTGKVLSCGEFAFLGQSMYETIVLEYSRLCPVSACNYNRFSTACRVSCACTDRSAMSTTGDRLCLDKLSEMNDTTVTKPTEIRCEGMNCRQQLLAPSAMGLMPVLMPYINSFGYCPPPFSDQCDHEFAAAAFTVVGYPMSDAALAAFETFSCIERKYGVAGLDALATYDHRNLTIAEWMLTCMKQDLQFDGLVGSVNFKYRNSPSPGHTTAAAMQGDNLGRGALITGVFTPTDLIEFRRVWWRANPFMCKQQGQIWSSICPPGTEITNVDLGNVLMRGFPDTCPLGQSPLPLGQHDPMDLPHATVFTCMNCTAGTYSEREGAELCQPCPLGMFSEAGSARCRQCDANTRALDHASDVLLRDERTQRFGSSGCEPCPLGTVSEPGSVRCNSCVPGRVRGPDDALCELCHEGRFQELFGMANCTSCQEVIAGSNSARGATSPSECMCPQNTYLDGHACQPCPDKLVCPGGILAPRQTEGFWVDLEDVQDGYQVYRCRNFKECPAGALGSCAPGREGMACNNCQAFHYQNSDGGCDKCASGDVFVVIFCVLGVLFLSIPTFIFLRDNVEKQRLTMLTVLMTVGQVIMVVQALGAIRQLSIDFPQPAKAIMDAMTVLTLDLDFIRVTCLLQKDNPVTKFTMQLLTYPIIIVVLGTAWLIARKVNRALPFDTMFNINGLLLLAFFITLTLTVLLPFQCMGNPNDSLTLMSNPGVLCWDSSEHTALVLLGILGALMYPVAILAWTIWAVVTQPHRIASGMGIERARRYRFLFNRFTPERYYYGVVYLIRNTLVALVPVIFVRLMAIQVVAMSTVLAFFAGLQAKLWPWRTDAANVSDLAMTLALIVMLTAAAPLVDISMSDKERVLGAMLFGILMALFSCFLLALGHALYRRFRPAQQYHMFLCHHKAGAGVLARYIKMVLVRACRARVFLDADQLEDLELIFETVRSATGHLVLLLTSEVLTRMWCAGEIVTAERCKVPVIPMECDGYVKPDDAAIKKICSLWTTGEQHTLATYGITIDMVEESYRLVVATPATLIDRNGSQKAQEEAIFDLARRCGISLNMLASTFSEATSPRILVAGACDDPEVLSTCMVVQSLVQSTLQIETTVVRDAEQIAEKGSYAAYVLVLLSKGMLASPSFAECIFLLTQTRIEVVTASTNDGFQFPSADFYLKIEQEGLPEINAKYGSKSKKVLAEAYRSLLRVLALPLTPLGSQGLLDKQVADIARRFKRFQKIGEDEAVSSAQISPIAAAASIVAAGDLGDDALKLQQDATLLEEEFLNNPGINRRMV